MLRRSLLLFVGLGLLSGCAQQSASQLRVERLLGQMSVEEKVGQMTQLTIAALKDESHNGSVRFDPVKLEKAILKYGVGSILNADNVALTVDEWHALQTQIQDLAAKTPNGIPVLYGIDAIHGVTYTRDSTLFPHNIGLAASRDRSLVEEGAWITALETRASGIRWNFDPVLDVGRVPLWARFPETFGEDPYLCTEMGLQVFAGYNRDGLTAPTSVAGCMKHYVGYSGPVSGKDRTPAYIPDNEMWETYLPPFEAAIAAGAPTIMINSGSVNGVPVHASYYWLHEVLREQLGFEGMIVTDWEDVIRLHTRHKVAETPREAVRMAVEAGIDMSMVPMDYSFADHLVDLVHSGEISERRLDASVRRILQLKADVGLFDNAYPEDAATANFGKPEYRDAALRAAQASMTLLENRNSTLPLPKSSRVLVAGPCADSIAPLNGSWSFTWQGDNEAEYPDDYLSVVEAIQAKIGAENVVTTAVRGFGEAGNYDTSALQRAAAGVDQIVLCLGENAYAEGPGSIDDLTLDGRQVALAQAALATGKPVVLVLIEGRPRVIRSFVDSCAAVLLAYQPGSMGANAIADVLFGDYNPHGILPFSYPRNTGDHVPHDRPFLTDVSRGGDKGYHPQWAFGHGLSYTRFEVESLKVDKTELRAGETLQVSATIRNVGGRSGSHAVDLLVRDEFASRIHPAMQRLRGFTSVTLDSGESETVTFTLRADDLAYYDVDVNRVVEAGTFTVMVGDQSTQFALLD